MEAGGFYGNDLEKRLDKELKMEERLRRTQEQDKNFLVRHFHLNISIVLENLSGHLKMIILKLLHSI